MFKLRRGGTRHTFVLCPAQQGNLQRVATGDMTRAIVQTNNEPTQHD